MTKERDYRLDLLKALAITLVLIWHLQPIKISTVHSSSQIGIHIHSLLNWIYLKTLVAVPIFYFVSLLLFFKKTPSYLDLGKRVKRLLNIFLFWFIVQMIFYLFVQKIFVLLNLHIPFPKSNAKLWWVFVMGGPALPFVGDSVFYFLSDLIILVILSYYYNKITTRNTDIAAFILLSLYMFFHQFYFGIPYWRIDNFLVYIPISHFFSQKENKHLISNRCFYVTLCTYICFVSYEHFMRKYLLYTAYDVNSVQWGTIALFMFVSIKNFTKNKAIQWLSINSLGIYALHKYFQFLYFLVFSSNSFLNHGILIKGVVFEFKYVIVAFMTCISCILAIRLLGRFTYLKQYMS